jgi:diaminohydroxyphosphoribosylaminopyrimidine deaminase/5-amino-6-(5-phosphoribosylamino)uracil reductase
MARRFADAAAVMRRAIELAAMGIGSVEPNPPVGAVLVDDRLELVSEGFHRRFGGPHAEVEAIGSAGAAAGGSTLFVTLEPCCHTGKTGPCTEAVTAAGIRRVVVACRDPNPAVGGLGLEMLQQRGIAVELGLLEEEAGRLIAPFAMLITRGRPWVHAKWAMTLDGKIATRTGDSRWVTHDASRALVHRLRGRMDAIVVGARTAGMDDPLLTVRPPGLRVPARIVVDANGALSPESKLVSTAREAPVIVAASTAAPPENIERLRQHAVEVLTLPPAGTGRPGASARPEVELGALLAELGRRQFTNVLVEGGGRLLGSLVDAALVDEVHVFVSPKIVGGADAPSPVAGRGVERMPEAAGLDGLTIEPFGEDVYINGRWRRLP